MTLVKDTELSITKDGKILSDQAHYKFKVTDVDSDGNNYEVELEVIE